MSWDAFGAAAPYVSFEHGHRVLPLSAKGRIERLPHLDVAYEAAAKLGHMPAPEPRVNDQRERWALILGASSGFGAAAGRSLAKAGYGIVGVHLDLRGTIELANAVRDEIAATGVPVAFHNANAADEEKRHQIVEATKKTFDERRAQGHDPFIAVVLHSLAFGTTLSYVTKDPDDKQVSQKQLEMTADVMAHSLVYWVRDLVHAGLLSDGSRVFAMTSEGSTKAVPTYGPVSAAKAALEAHVRQLALELIPRGITVNAIRAGVTDTPALRRIPGHEELRRAAEERNPGGRLTRPQDVGQALIALASPHLYWMTGNVIGVDGGEMMGARRDE